MKKIALFLPLLALAVGLACKEKKEHPMEFDCVGTMPVFKNDIGPILVGTCGISGCHDKDAHLSGYDFSDYEGVKKAVFEQKNAFLGAIQHREGYAYMPINDSQLPESLVKRISCWVQNGAPE